MRRRARLLNSERGRLSGSRAERILAHLYRMSKVGRDQQKFRRSADKWMNGRQRNRRRPGRIAALVYQLLTELKQAAGRHGSLEKLPT